MSESRFMLSQSKEILLLFSTQTEYRKVPVYGMQFGLHLVLVNGNSVFLVDPKSDVYALLLVSM